MADGEGPKGFWDKLSQNADIKRLLARYGLDGFSAILSILDFRQDREQVGQTAAQAEGSVRAVIESSRGGIGSVFRFLGAIFFGFLVSLAIVVLILVPIVGAKEALIIAGGVLAVFALLASRYISGAIKGSKHRVTSAVSSVKRGKQREILDVMFNLGFTFPLTGAQSKIVINQVKQEGVLDSQVNNYVAELGRVRPFIDPGDVSTWPEELR